MTTLGARTLMDQPTKGQMNLIVSYDEVPGDQDLAWMLRNQAEVALHDGAFWFQLRDGTQPDETAVLSGVCWRLVGTDRLCRLDQTVPSRRLPHPLDWQAVQRVIALELPVARFPSRNAMQVSVVESIGLKRGGPFSPPKGMLVDAPTLVDWVDDAPEVRLRALKFVTRDNIGLVMGDPLPSIEGRYVTQHHRLLVPAGWTWTPELPASVIGDWLAKSETPGTIDANECLFLGLERPTDESGDDVHCRWSTIQPGEWVQVSRKAVRSWQC